MFNFLAIVLATVLAMFTLLYLFQQSIIYPAPRTASIPDSKLPENIKKLYLGDAFAYLMLPTVNSEETFPLIIYTHGNGETATMWLPAFSEYQQHNIAIMLIEYPGYADASGSPNLQSIKETMLKGFDLAAAMPEIDSENVVAYGRSIGGGAASLLAGERKLSGLILESTFSSLQRLVAEKGFPSFLLKDRYDIESIVKKLDIPILLYHGTRDITIPYSHSKTLESVAKDVTFYSEKCGHNDCPRIDAEILLFLRDKVGFKI